MFWGKTAGFCKIRKGLNVWCVHGGTFYIWPKYFSHSLYAYRSHQKKWPGVAI
jgi:hypothetical protein